MKILNFLTKYKKTVKMSRKRESKKGNNYMKNKLNSEVKKTTSKKMTKIVKFIETTTFFYLFILITYFFVSKLSYSIFSNIIFKFTCAEISGKQINFLINLFNEKKSSRT